MEFSTKTGSPEQRKALLNWLFQRGFIWHGENKWNPDAVERHYPHRIYPCIVATPTNKHISGSVRHKITIIEFCNALGKINEI